MARLLCLFGRHRWRRAKWGASLDCRACMACGRFQIWAYWRWHDYDRARIVDVEDVA